MIFPFCSLFSQNKNESEKFLLKRINKIKRHYNDSKYNIRKRNEVINELILYLDRKEKNRVSLKDYCESVNFIVNKLEKNPRRNYKTILSKFKQDASENFYQLNLALFSNIHSDSIHRMSAQWNDMQQLISQNKVSNYRNYHSMELGNWIETDLHNEENLSNIYSKIFKYYFLKLQNSQNIDQQNQIEMECLSLFPKINQINFKEYRTIPLIVSGWDNNASWSNGNIKLFRVNFLNEYLNNDIHYNYLAKDKDLNKQITSGKLKGENTNYLELLRLQMAVRYHGSIQYEASYKWENNKKIFDYIKTNPSSMGKEGNDSSSYVKFNAETNIIQKDLVEQSWKAYRAREDAKNRLVKIDSSYIHKKSYECFDDEKWKSIQDVSLKFLKDTIESNQLQQLLLWSSTNYKIKSDRFFLINNVLTETFTFKNGRLKDTIHIVKDENYSYEIILNELDNTKDITEFSPIQINYFDKGQLWLSDFTRFSNSNRTNIIQAYSYDFMDGKNISLENLEKKISESKELISEKKYDKAIDLLNSASNNFPKSINQNIELARLIIEATDKFNLCEQVLDQKWNEIYGLMENKEFSKALLILTEARDNKLLSTNRFNVLFDQKITEVNQLIKDELVKIAELDNKIKEGKTLLKNKEYWNAKVLFENARKQNQFSDTLKQNKELDLLIVSANDKYKKDLDLKIQKQKIEDQKRAVAAKKNQSGSNKNIQSNSNQIYTPAYEPSTEIKEKSRKKCSPCYGSGLCSECGKAQEDGYFNRNHDYVKIREIRMGMVICEMCHGEGEFMDTGECRSCKSTGWVFCNKCNYGGRTNENNIGRCRNCNGTGYKD